MDDEEERDRLQTYLGVASLTCKDVMIMFMSHALKPNGERNLVMLKLLVDQARVLHQNFFESPTFGFCVFRCIQMGYKDVITCLLEEGVSPNLYFHGRTMLHEAVRISNERMILFLLSLPGIDKNAYDDNNRTALMYAARGKPQCLKILLEAGCDFNLTDKGGQKALHVAVNAPQAHLSDITTCLDLLRAYGADINERGAHSKTCLQRAVESNMQWLLAWLIHNNCDFDSPLSYFSLKSHCSRTSKTVLCPSSSFLLACKLKNRIFAEVLISAGCDFRQDRWVLDHAKPVQYLYESLEHAFQQVSSLRLCCRKVLRSHLSTDIIAESTQLGLPQPLLCFLLCHEEMKVLGTMPECETCRLRVSPDL